MTQAEGTSGDYIRVMFLKFDQILGIWPWTLAENHGWGCLQEVPGGRGAEGKGEAVL